MARRKPAPHYQPGVYEMEFAFSGGRIAYMRIIAVRLVEFNGGKYADYLYTIEQPGKNGFGPSIKTAWQNEVNTLIRSAAAQKKAA